MGAEGVGSLLLIRTLTVQSGSAEAGLFVLVTYAWLAMNVVGNALGFVAARTAAQAPQQAALHGLVETSKRLAHVLLVPLAGVILLVILGFAWRGDMEPRETLAWAIFVTAHIVRLRALVQVFVVVGSGQLGADKLFQLSAVLAFYLVAVPLASHGAPTLVLAMVYLVAVGCSSVGASQWVWSALTPTHDAAAPMEADGRTVFRDTLRMIAFAGAGFVAGNADALVARWLFEDSAFVQYSLATKVGQVVALLASLLPAVYGPRISRLHANQEWSGLRRVRRLSLVATLAISSCLAAALLALDTSIARLLSPTDGAVLLAVLWVAVPGAVLQAVALALSNAVNSVGGRGLVGLTLANAGLAVLVSTFAGHWWGAQGIAAGTVAGNILMVAGLLHITTKIFSSQRT